MDQKLTGNETVRTDERRKDTALLSRPKMLLRRIGEWKQSVKGSQYDLCAMFLGSSPTSLENCLEGKMKD